jgi:hypothetical protein
MEVVRREAIEGVGAATFKFQLVALRPQRFDVELNNAKVKRGRRGW